MAVEVVDGATGGAVSQAARRATIGTRAARFMPERYTLRAACDDVDVTPPRAVLPPSRGRHACALSLLLLGLVAPAACSGASATGGAPGGNYTATGPAPAGWQAEILAAHNQHRAAHCAPALAWSAEIASVAQGWADHLASGGCDLEHSSGDLGENLAGGTKGAIGASRSVELWYGERPNYAGGFSMNSGHFSQLVWKGSARLGCGVASCSDKDVYVCNYDPPGNVEGQYAANVSAGGCR